MAYAQLCLCDSSVENVFWSYILLFSVQEEDENIAPDSAAGGDHFQFGAAAEAPAGGFNF